MKLNCWMFPMWCAVIIGLETYVSSLWFNKTKDLDQIIADDVARAGGASIDERIENLLLESTAKELLNGNMLGDAETSDEVLVEHDIIVTLKEYADMYLDDKMKYGGRSRRNAVPYDRRWPHATLVYKIAPMGFFAKELKLLRLAMTQWEHFTCVKFREKTESDKHFIEFQNKAKGCRSHLGIRRGKQDLNLQSPGCSFLATYLHELGHAIGLFHEHSRPDRDKYIMIDWNKVTVAEQFRKRKDFEAEAFDLEYGYDGLMHYGLKAFSKDDSQTIYAKSKEKEMLIQKAGEELTFKDIKVVNLMYKCNAHCKTNIQCREGGFVNKDCTCFCRDGTNNCQMSGLKPRKQECKNTMSAEKCEKYKKIGDCMKNPLFVLPKCKKTCGMCGIDFKGDNGRAKGHCKNPLGDEECSILAAAWFCDLSPAYMMVECPQMCGWCDKRDSGRACHNLWNSTECELFAISGYCRSTPEWMLAHCRYSCQICDRTDSSCVNEYKDEAKCYAYALSGECMNRVRWMYKNCRLACGKCKNLPGVQCRNVHSNTQCLKRAHAGNCFDIDHAFWMLDYCRKACREVMCADGCSELGGPKCASWGQRGECYVNPSYMLQLCQKTCSVALCPLEEKQKEFCVNRHPDNLCSEALVSTCNVLSSTNRLCYRTCSGCAEDNRDTVSGGKCVNEDSDDKCWDDKVMGKCESSEEVKSLCHRSCSGCGGDADKGKDCLDSSVVCLSNKMTGFCERDPAAMVKSCKKTCGFCDQRKYEQTLQSWKTRFCNDKLDSSTNGSDRCQSYLDAGECATSQWVITNCMRTCGKCEKCSNYELDAFCDQTARSGLCVDWEIKKRCAKSCGFCKSEVPHSTPENLRLQSSTGPVTTRKTASLSVGGTMTSTPGDFCRHVTNSHKAKKTNEDPDSQCRLWAANGYCNGGYVKSSCRKTCECDKCFDTNEQKCRQQAVKGSCFAQADSVKKWMTKHCAKTCHFCEVSEGSSRIFRMQTNPAIPGKATPTVTYRLRQGCFHVTNLQTSNDANDPDRKCKQWAAEGQCANSFMKKYCLKTCTCDTCFDVDKKDCLHKASVGSCESSSAWHDWMTKYCAKTCGICRASVSGAANTVKKVLKNPVVCEGGTCYVKKWIESCCDKTSDCKVLADVSCFTSQIIRERCPKSCGLCTQTCTDHTQWGPFKCKKIRSWCNDRRYEVLKDAQQFCSLTCGFCEPCRL